MKKTVRFDYDEYVKNKPEVVDGEGNKVIGILEMLPPYQDRLLVLNDKGVYWEVYKNDGLECGGTYPKISKIGDILMVAEQRELWIVTWDTQLAFRSGTGSETAGPLVGFVFPNEEAANVFMAQSHANSHEKKLHRIVVDK